MYGSVRRNRRTPAGDSGRNPTTALPEKVLFRVDSIVLLSVSRGLSGADSDEAHLLRCMLSWCDAALSDRVQCGESGAVGPLALTHDPATMIYHAWVSCESFYILSKEWFRNANACATICNVLRSSRKSLLHFDDNLVLNMEGFLPPPTRISPVEVVIMSYKLL